MLEKAGIVAGIVTFLGFSTLCVWHHAKTMTSNVASAPPVTSSPSVTLPAPPVGSPAALPTSPAVIGTAPVTTATPTPATPPVTSQSQPETLIPEPLHQQPVKPALRGKVIEFLADSDLLTPKGRDILKTLLPGLRSSSVQQIEIVGHTDNLGDEDHNRDLSQRRAESIKHYLIMQGISEESMTTQGYGSSLPIADNATVEGRQRNRRAEIIIHRTASGS
jgi:OOP family OmpA-OmpF porin